MRNEKGGWRASFCPFRRTQRLQKALNLLFDEVGQCPVWKPLNLLRIRARQRWYYGLSIGWGQPQHNHLCPAGFLFIPGLRLRERTLLNVAGRRCRLFQSHLLWPPHILNYVGVQTNPFGRLMQFLSKIRCVIKGWHVPDIYSPTPPTFSTLLRRRCLLLLP